MSIVRSVCSYHILRGLWHVLVRVRPNGSHPKAQGNSDFWKLWQSNLGFALGRTATVAIAVFCRNNDVFLNRKGILYIKVYIKIIWPEIYALPLNPLSAGRQWNAQCQVVCWLEVWIYAIVWQCLESWLSWWSLGRLHCPILRQPANPKFNSVPWWIFWRIICHIPMRYMRFYLKT